MKTRPYEHPFSATIWILLIVFVAGCGPSKEELMMRSARRVRQADDEEKKASEQPAEKVSRPAPPKEKKEETPPPSGRMAKKEEAPKEDVEEKPETPAKPLLTIDDLRPKEPLSENERRKWAYDNVVAVGDAIYNYQKSKNTPVPRIIKTDSGIEAFSWRVWLLPALGYQELYDKFDFSKPWYMEPNKSLLKYIPKEYVSPERFDTMTNLQLPATSGHMYGDLKNMSLSYIEDGLANTIMLVEVNDALAVEWTAPLDFVCETRSEITSGIGKLRGDGTFAVWGNGWPFLLSNKANRKDVLAAFSCAALDGKSASILHKPIPIDGLTDASLARDTAESPVESSTGSASVEVNMDLVQNETLIEREAVPSSIETRKAMERLKRAFGEDVNDAKTDKKKLSLASKLMKTANQVEVVPSDAHALLIVAQNLSSDAGDAAKMIDAVDLRVGRFAEDAFEINIDALAKFSEKNAKRDASTIDGADEFAKRAVRTIFAATESNEFSRAANIARACNKYYADDDTTELRGLFGRLRSQLTAANRQFDDAKEQLEIIRVNPDNDAAAERFGQFLCFFKGDWETGLPLLARTSNSRLSDAIELDLTRPTETNTQVELAEMWWSLSESAAGVFKQGAIDRALVWYELSLGGLPDSLERIHVENRIDECRDADPTSPLALCRRLAEELGVDLRQSLTTVAVSQVQSRAKNRDDNG